MRNYFIFYLCLIISIEIGLKINMKIIMNRLVGNISEVRKTFMSDIMKDDAKQNNLIRLSLDLLKISVGFLWRIITITIPLVTISIFIPDLLIIAITPIGIISSSAIVFLYLKIRSKGR